MTDTEQVNLLLKLVQLLTKGPQEANNSDGFWEIGKPYFIRTVTHHLTGRLIAVTNQELWLEDAAWIADDGRFSQAVESGEFQEVEPFPSGRSVAVGRGALIDATLINTTPRGQK